MAYAPHTNVQVQQQLRAGMSPTKLPLILGQFRYAGSANFFEYAERRHPDDTFAPDMPHMIYVGPAQEARLAKVLKTVAYVVTDEAADGSPVIEKWQLASHHRYLTEWVRA